MNTMDTVEVIRSLERKHYRKLMTTLLLRNSTYEKMILYVKDSCSSVVLLILHDTQYCHKFDENCSNTIFAQIPEDNA